MMNINKLNELRREYAEEWMRSSKRLYSDGDYAWMSSLIKQKGIILEIGVGVGYSTLQLLKDGYKVIGVDENPICLDFAEKLLAESGYNVARVRRDEVKTNSDSYEIDYKNIDIDPEEFDVILLDGDLLHKEDFKFFDKNLVSWLSKIPFIGVICWLIGTHGGRMFNNNLLRDIKKYSSAAHYRIQNQNSAYELADMILQDGGMLHVVDRSQSFEEKDIRKLHEEQASITCLKISSIDHKTFKPATEGAQYTTDSKIITSLEDTLFYLISVLSIKSNNDENTTVE